MSIRTIAMALCVALGSTVAHAADYTFRLHHFLPDDSKIQRDFLRPWADSIERDSGGRIQIDIYGGMSLGGKPSELVDQVENGVVDMVWTVAGYTPGRFPRTEVFELPTVHFRSAYATNRSIFANFDLIKDDFKNVKPLLVHVNAGNAIQMTGQSITHPDQLRGIQLRTPSRTATWLMEAMGANPVAMPAPAIKNALDGKEIDGAFLPFEILPDLNLLENNLYATYGKDGSRFGTSSFLFLMNQKTFRQLPDDLQAVIDDHTGLELYKTAGVIWDEMEVPGLQGLHDTLVKLDLDQLEPFEAYGQQVVKRWINEVAPLGINGELLVDNARKYVGRYSRIITSVDVNF